ncbi:MAG: NADH-quinone oxidoreductase subunit NuoK [Deltaproteobacteria bacterium]|jgi:NADH-quinone oxidoreductase subunit K|nr:NADH-quinone oxidoreductase subunit NuoK [Deltaproteobacteria bacterium]MBW1904730.1 NADH-quinone oxidoreductase subunit NuoK [Deltaproteobacteria bacterium]MBW2159022.1 NADH-quinone oxidoreductase subunit NuoK [Deltaproteobacteria bacterium]MBW2375362.1 NADH-quinone oxidoreductase subunit NuoK [Deltaproteobacteria bacterium]MBW2586530.1 NADH-quinone oxidoreductase subunit NuoK [Deltaproteobacteria bacterium]
MGIGTYLALASVLFGIGASGFLVRRNMLIQLMSIELMLNSVNVVLLAFNRAYPANHDGQVFAFFVIAVAAAEAAVGLAILIAYYRIKKTLDTDDATLLKY